MRLSSLIKSITFAGLALVPNLVLAQATKPKPPLFESIGAVAMKACGVFNILFTGAIIVTIIFVLLAGIQYITQGSDPSKVSEAHQKLIWAAVGFGVALLARVVPSIVASFLGTSLEFSC